MTRLILILTLLSGCAAPRSELAVEARWEDERPVVVANFKVQVME